jgi:hypothetical protein
MIEFKAVRGMMGPWGTWVVGDKTFYKKLDALKFASSINSRVYYRYYNKIWENFDRTKLGKISLLELYRLRAQQLRDKYDHLTLFYSGGADSHNALHTFLVNNIKLDHIVVNWPKKALNNPEVYTPNIVDTSSKNILSEWDYCIVPTLKYLGQNHPEIEIEVIDWSENLTEKFYVDDNYIKSNLYYGVGSIPRNLTLSKIAQSKLESGKKVASVYGFDKPHLFLHDDGLSVSMFFHDAAFQTASNCIGAFEPFYWTPDLPELPFEMAYVNLQWYDRNPDQRRYLRSHPMRVSREVTNEFNNDLCRQICYPYSWDINKFQSGKPWNGARRDRDFWIYESKNELSRIVQAWEYNYRGFLDGINSNFFDESGGFNPIRSQMFYLGRFTEKNNQSNIIIN